MVYKLFKLLALDLRAVAVPEDEIRVLVFADYPAELVLSDPEIYGASSTARVYRSQTGTAMRPCVKSVS